MWRCNKKINQEICCKEKWERTEKTLKWRLAWLFSNHLTQKKVKIVMVTSPQSCLFQICCNLALISDCLKQFAEQTEKNKLYQQLTGITEGFQACQCVYTLNILQMNTFKTHVLSVAYPCFKYNLNLIWQLMRLFSGTSEREYKWQTTSWNKKSNNCARIPKPLTRWCKKYTLYMYMFWANW